MNEKELARELLIERIRSYMRANQANIPGAHIVDQWYPECLLLAKAIIEKAN